MSDLTTRVKVEGGEKWDIVVEATFTLRVEIPKDQEAEIYSRMDTAVVDCASQCAAIGSTVIQ